MTQINFGRIIKSLPSLSDEQTIALRQELDREMAQRGIINIGSYDEGYTACHNDLLERHKALQPIINHVDRANIAIASIQGAARAGSGQMQRDYIHDMSVQLAGCKEGLSQDMARIALEQKDLRILNGVDFKPINDILKEARYAYATGDMTGLYLRPGSTVESVQEIHDWRAKLLSGADRDSIIDLICRRAKPYIESGLPYGKTLDQLMIDYENSPEELQQIDGWGESSFRKAFQSRYPQFKKQH